MRTFLGLNLIPGLIIRVSAMNLNRRRLVGAETANDGAHGDYGWLVTARGVGLVSLGQLGVALRGVLDHLPVNTIAEATERVTQSRGKLAEAGRGTRSEELPAADSALSVARDTLVSTAGLLTIVREQILTYLQRYGIDEGWTPSSPPSAPASPEAAPGGPPSGARPWETVADEHGAVRSFPSYEAAKQALGWRLDRELHHLVEQSQTKSHRSGFPAERVNSTDNLVWIPPEVHRLINSKYSRKPLGGSAPTLRDSLNGKSWEHQYDIGERELDRAWKKMGRMEN